MPSQHPGAGQADLVEQLWLAVQEESALCYVPGGATDLVLGRQVRHGPWPPQACAIVLRAWHAAGWIELELAYQPEGMPLPAGWEDRLQPVQVGAHTRRVLAAPDAAAALAAPEHWLADRIEGHLCLNPTNPGLAHPPPHWHALASQALMAQGF